MHQSVARTARHRIGQGGERPQAEVRRPQKSRASQKPAPATRGEDRHRPTRSQGQGSKIMPQDASTGARETIQGGDRMGESAKRSPCTRRDSGPGQAPAEGRPRADQKARQSQDQTAPPSDQRSAVSVRVTCNADRRRPTSRSEAAGRLASQIASPKGPAIRTKRAVRRALAARAHGSVPFMTKPARQMPAGFQCH